MNLSRPFETEYDRNSENRDRIKAEEARARSNAALQPNANAAIAGTPAGSPAAPVTNPNILSGTRSEQAGQLAGLNAGTIGYGQGLGQTAEDIQRVKELQRNRTDQAGGDPVSAAIMGQKASNVANAGRNLASSGVKGGAAAGVIDNVGRAADADIAASLYGQQRTSIGDERSMASNTLAGLTGLMYGEKAANVKAPSTPSDSGSSFICTMLRSKGLMTKRESIQMTVFMLKGLPVRANFLLWYFKEGKKAVDCAEAAGLDWANYKVFFVDHILDRAKTDVAAAQALYIERTGILCTSFGAKGYTSDLEKLNKWNILLVPKLFTIKVCRQWFATNFTSIPKLLKYSAGAKNV